MKDIEDYQFNKIGILVVNLLTNPVSALYYTGIKDRLYCDNVDDISRKTSQHVLFQIFEIVSRAIAPIVPHLVEEMFLYLPQKSGHKTYFTSPHNEPEAQWKNFNIEKLMIFILNVKKEINRQHGANTVNLNVELGLHPTNITQIQVISLEIW